MYLINRLDFEYLKNIIQFKLLQDPTFYLKVNTTDLLALNSGYFKHFRRTNEVYIIFLTYFRFFYNHEDQNIFLIFVITIGVYIGLWQ